MTEFTTALDLEIQHLEKIVETIPEVVKLRELQRVRALYGPRGIVAQARAMSESTAIVSGAGRKMAPERQQAIEFVSTHLSAQVNPIKTADLLLTLQANGINIGGSDPVNSLSALLSTSGKFVAHGRSGWTLKPSNNDNQVPAPATAGNGNPGSGEPGQG